MTDKELRKLSKSKLLELYLDERRRNEQLTEQLSIANGALKSRRIKLEKCGSLAEAALALTAVFDEAQKAADLYLENIASEETCDEAE